MSYLRFPQTGPSVPPLLTLPHRPQTFAFQKYFLTLMSAHPDPIWDRASSAFLQQTVTIFSTTFLH